jgi:hypothetical protein
VVTSITLVNGGSGYSGAPTVTIATPPVTIVYTTYWSNDGTSGNGSEPTGAVNVAVAAGLFTVALGDTNLVNMAGIDSSLFSQPNLQLRIWFNDGVHGFAALSPFQNLTPAPYATYAINAGNVNGGLTVQNNSAGAPNVIGGASVNFVSNGVAGATIGGGGAVNYYSSSYTNSVTADYGTVSGGFGNTANGQGATVSGGLINTASSQYSTVGGGQGNTASGGGVSTVGGGFDNTASGTYGTVSGGSENTASGGFSTVGGGRLNTASGGFAAVSGGYGNTASGEFATVSGGYGNTASGDSSFAAGANAQTTNNGSFVWNDSTGSTFSSTTSNQFAVHASGGVVLAANVKIGTNYGDYHNLQLGGGNSTGYLYGSFPALGDGVHLGYNYYYDASGNGHILITGGATSRLSVGYGFVGIYIGGVNAAPSTQRLLANSTGVTVNGTFNTSSDRNVKQDFAAVSPAQMLERVTQLPISEWSYKEDPTTRHVGPMGQDFYAAFNIGTDEKHIAPIDEGGIAFAAIQGLNQKVEEKDTEIQNLKRQNQSLERRLNKLEMTIQSIVEKK